MLKIIRNDGIRVVRTVRVDMIDSFFQRIDDFNRKNRSVVFLRPIIFGRVFHPTEIFQNGLRSRIAAKFHAFLEIDGADLG